MVVRRTIHHLRSKSRYEREAVAAWGAIVVVAVLFVFWAFFFFRSLAGSVQAQQMPNATVENPYNNQDAEAAQAIQALQNLVSPASSGYVAENGTFTATPSAPTGSMHTVPASTSTAVEFELQQALRQ